MNVVYRYDPTCGSYCNGPRMECVKDGDWIAVEDYESASHQRDTLRAEVERLREALWKVHALVAEAVSGTAVWSPLVEIHKITKGMVASDAD